MFFEHKIQDIEVFKCVSFDFPHHLHNNIEILVCTNGTFDMICNEKNRVLKGGEVMVAFPGDVHAYRKTDYGEGIMIIFNPNISEIIVSLLANVKYENFVMEKNAITLAQSMLNSFDNNSNYAIIYGYLHTIVGMVLKKSLTQKTNTETSVFNSAIRYIAFNYTNQITLKSVSKHIGISQSHLSRIFSQKVEGGFKCYLNLMRVEKAKELLTNTEKNIYEIMLDAGFNDQGTFNRVFKQNTNCTPREYRAKIKKHLL